MQFVIERDVLLPAIRKVSNALSNRSAMPILQTILFEADENKLTITATNLDYSISTALNVETKEKAAFTIQGKKLLQLISNIGKGELTFIVEKDITTILSNKNKYTLSGQSPDDFPKIKDLQAEGIALDTSVIQDGVNYTSFCTSKDDVRAFLNGILVEIQENEIRFVSSDAHRLAFYKKRIEEINIKDKRSAIVPKDVFDFLKEDTEKEVTIAFSENLLKMAFENSFLVTRLIEGPYVPYENVIPEEEKNVLVCDKAALSGALKRILSFTPQGTNLTDIHVGKETIIHAEDRETGEAVETLSCMYDGSEMDIGFNAAYLLDIARHIPGDKIRIVVNDAEQAVKLESEQKSDFDLLYLLMPIKLE